MQSLSQLNNNSFNKVDIKEKDIPQNKDSMFSGNSNIANNNVATVKEVNSKNATKTYNIFSGNSEMNKLNQYLFNSLVCFASTEIDEEYDKKTIYNTLKPKYLELLGTDNNTLAEKFNEVNIKHFEAAVFVLDLFDNKDIIYQTIRSFYTEPVSMKEFCDKISMSLLNISYISNIRISKTLCLQITDRDAFAVIENNVQIFVFNKNTLKLKEIINQPLQDENFLDNILKLPELLPLNPVTF